MNCPYYIRLLLEPYADHPVVGAWVTDLLASAIHNLGQALDTIDHPSLSTGEHLTVALAVALWNGDTEARIADLFRMDTEHQKRACDAIAAKFLYSTEE